MAATDSKRMLFEIASSTGRKEKKKQRSTRGAGDRGAEKKRKKQSRD
jgi:hypothetical protein